MNVAISRSVDECLSPCKQFHESFNETFKIMNMFHNFLCIITVQYNNKEVTFKQLKFCHSWESTRGGQVGQLPPLDQGYIKGKLPSWVRPIKRLTS